MVLQHRLRNAYQSPKAYGRDLPATEQVVAGRPSDTHVDPKLLGGEELGQVRHRRGPRDRREVSTHRSVSLCRPFRDDRASPRPSVCRNAASTSARSTATRAARVETWAAKPSSWPAGSRASKAAFGVTPRPATIRPPRWMGHEGSFSEVIDPWTTHENLDGIVGLRSPATGYNAADWLRAPRSRQRFDGHDPGLWHVGARVGVPSRKERLRAAAGLREKLTVQGRAVHGPRAYGSRNPFPPVVRDRRNRNQSTHAPGTVGADIQHQGDPSKVSKPLPYLYLAMFRLGQDNPGTDLRGSDTPPVWMAAPAEDQTEKTEGLVPI